MTSDQQTGTSAESQPDLPATTRVPSWLLPWVSWRYWRFRLLAVIVLYTLGGFFLAPWLVERTLVKQAAEIDRTASVQSLRMNPYLLTLEVQGFALDDTDGKRLIAFDRLLVDLQTRSLIDWAVNLRLLRLDTLAVFDERFEGFDTRLMRLLEDLSSEEDPNAADEPLPRAIVQRLEIEDAQLDFIDQPADSFAGRLGPISVEVDDVRTLPDHSGQQAVRVQINPGDYVSWRGDLQLVPFRSTGLVEFRGRSLPNTRRYLDHYLPFDIAFEGVSADLAYEAAVHQDGLTLVVSDFSGAVDALALQPDDLDESLITVARAEASGGRFDLATMAGHLDRVSITGLGAETVLRPDGSLNLLDLLPATETPGAADETAATSTSGEPPLALTIDALVVTGDGVNLRDESFSPPLEIGVRGLDVSMSGIDLLDGTTMPLSIGARLASGGNVQFDGAVGVFPAVQATGELVIDALSLAVAQPAVDGVARANIAGGTLNLAGDLVHGPEQLLALGGEMSIDALAIDDTVRAERLAAWDRMTLERFEVDLAANTVETSVIDFEALYGRVHIAEDRSTNIGDLLIDAPAVDTPNSDSAADDSDPMAGLPAITIGGIRMAGTALDFSDFSLPLPFEAAIRDMEGEISTLATGSSEPATVALEGQVNEFGLARINGTVNALDPTRQTDIQMVFRNLEISRLSPYSIAFAGYAIETGRLDTDLAYVLQDRKLQGDNSVIIREMTLGEKSDHPDAGNLPLGLAVALLKDSEGVIDLDVPVEGDLDSPEFGIGSVILQALGNLITRAVTAPFRLLGNLVGVDSEDFGVLSFQPGDAELSPPDREQLLKLAEAMTQRPELTLDVAGTWDSAVDGPALQRARVEARMIEWQAANPGPEDELSNDEERRTLEALFAESFPGEALEGLRAASSAPPAEDPEGTPVLDVPAYLARIRDRLVADTPLTEGDFIALGKARSSAVMQALTPPDGAAREIRAREVEPVPVDADENDDAERGAVPLELAVSVEE